MSDVELILAQWCRIACTASSSCYSLGRDEVSWIWRFCPMERSALGVPGLQFDLWQPSDSLDSEAFSDLVQLLASSQELRGRRQTEWDHSKFNTHGKYGNMDPKVPLFAEDRRHHRARSSWLAAVLLGSLEISWNLSMFWWFLVLPFFFGKLWCQGWRFMFAKAAQKHSTIFPLASR